MERAGRDRFRKQGLEPGLDHRTVTGGDGRHLHFVRIDSPDVVTVRSQARGGDGADITKPEDGDLHASECRGAAVSAQCDGVMHNMSRAAPLKYTRLRRSAGRGPAVAAPTPDPPILGQEAWRRRLFDGFGGLAGRPFQGPPGTPRHRNGSQLGVHPELQQDGLDL